MLALSSLEQSAQVRDICSMGFPQASRLAGLHNKQQQTEPQPQPLPPSQVRDTSV